MNDALMRGFVSELQDMEKGAAFGKGIVGVGKLIGRAITGTSPGKKVLTRSQLAGQALQGAKGLVKKHPGKSLATAAGAGLGAGYMAGR